jgi:hypothetical protein
MVMAMYEFTARASAATDLPDLNVFSVVLAENRDGSGRRVEIQRSSSFSEQDRRLGQDTYCVSTGAGASYYGGISSWRLAEDRLEIHLDAKAAEVLGVTGGFAVRLEATEEERRSLREGLLRVLNEHV